jgi:hypothetical protein
MNFEIDKGLASLDLIVHAARLCGVTNDSLLRDTISVDVPFFPKPLNLHQLLHAIQELARGA